jgi:hypothetical protein
MHARHVYAWQSAIVALPIVLITASYSFIYPNYLVAYNSETLIAYAYMALIFWSVGVSYVGVNTRFELTKWKARLWFLALPIVFYVLALGLIVGLVSYLS